MMNFKSEPLADALVNAAVQLTALSVTQPQGNYQANPYGTYTIPTMNALSITAPSAPRSIGQMGFDADGDIALEFYSVENGNNLTLKFCPEYNMTMREQTQIMMLTVMAAAHAYTNPERAILFIRLHNLERHFIITA